MNSRQLSIIFERFYCSLGSGERVYGTGTPGIYHEKLVHFTGQEVVCCENEGLRTPSLWQLFPRGRYRQPCVLLTARLLLFHSRCIAVVLSGETLVLLLSSGVPLEASGEAVLLLLL